MSFIIVYQKSVPGMQSLGSSVNTGCYCHLLQRGRQSCARSDQ